MPYTFTVKDEDLDRFLRSIVTYSARPKVKGWLASAGLNWDKYWDLPLDARVHFVNACLWAGMFPTPECVLEILKKEKRTGPCNAFINFRDKWWRNTKEIRDLVIKVYNRMDADLFLILLKRKNKYPILEYCKKEFLPLALTVKRVTENKFLMEMVTKRLKEV